ncbi:MAG TPA: glycine zipper domain-containing protein [Polyangiaceae bacterium]|nr:glycine zipper domain-containing protein [Polyangiaceae bacterium]
MNEVNEWGLAQASSTTPAATAFPTTPTAIGGGLGAVAGVLVGSLAKHPVAGALVGAAVGAGGGYYYGTKQTPTTSTPVSSGAPQPTPTGGGTTPPASGGGTTTSPTNKNTTINPASYLHSTPPEVAPGPYTIVPIAAGTWGVDLLPGETYLISIPAPATSGVTETQIVSEVGALGLTVIGSWGRGAAPTGWPAGDPNAAAGVFIGVTNGTGKSITVGSGAEPTVWATAGKTT